MNIPEIRKKFSTQFQGAKALLDGFGSHGEPSRIRGRNSQLAQRAKESSLKTRVDDRRCSVFGRTEQYNGVKRSIDHTY